MDHLLKGLPVIVGSVILSIGLVLAFGGDSSVGGSFVPGIAMQPISVTTLTQGGGVTSTTSAASASLLATDIDTENYVAVTPSLGNITITLPASSTFPGIPNPGDTRDLIIENAATAATTTTIAAGTGIDLQEPDGQNVVIGQNNYAYITCTRQRNTDIACRIDETIPAD